MADQDDAEIKALIAERRMLIMALRSWMCPSCGGTRTYLQRSKEQGTVKVACKVCKGTGLHATAAAALRLLNEI